jgi:uncharacterized RDD family membrane protein YckC
MSLDETKTVITPEQVPITYTLAGIGTRFGAAALDSFFHLVALALVALLILAMTLGLDARFGAIAWAESIARPWVIAVGAIVFFAVFWGYFIFWETIWNGQTPGKRLCGLRVMRDGGFPIDFRAAFVRNIMRYVDFLPFCYGVGALAMFASKDSKRLGDYAAGTIVVVDRTRPAPEHPTRVEIAPSRLLGDPSLLNLRAISPRQFAVVDRFLSRREELPAKARAEVARQIGAPLIMAMGMPAPGGDYPYEGFLIELAAAYRSSQQE